MAPDVEFLWLDLYGWMIVVGVIAAMVLFRALYQKVGISYRVFLLTVLSALLSVGTGYLSAVLFESLFELAETGVFVWGTGATFYGGLIGAAVTFLLIYFAVGKFLCRDGAYVKEFNRMLSLIAPCIALAHAFGRIGCLCEGCCYGALTDGPFGVRMLVGGVWERRIPVQLFESVFLFLLCATLVFLLLKKKGEYNGGLYPVLYGIWRFCIEFLRDDDRGYLGIPFLSPSQCIAVGMVLLGVGYCLFIRYFLKRRPCTPREDGHEAA